VAKIGDFVRRAIDEWEASELDFAMLHACIALDATARKLYPALRSNQARFTQALRDNYGIFGPLGMPGINLVDTRWPVTVPRPSALGGTPDIADVIYAVHRCNHAHGDELPDGFELIRNAGGPSRLTSMEIEKGKVRLSDRIIFGLLGVVVFSSVNTDQRVPAGYHLTFAGATLPINEWWGRAADFLALVATEPLSNVTLNFGEWMPPLGC
jgi:hypothetical protein